MDALMRLKELLAGKADQLTDADRRVIAVMLSDAAGSSFLPAHVIASRAGVHQSTAGRLARKLGFESYRELREELRGQVLEDVNPSGRVRRRLDRAGTGSILKSLIESEIRALSAIPDQISQPALERTASILKAAGTIIVFGESHAGTLADLFARRLTRSGYRASALQHADWAAADKLLSLQPGDAVVAIAFRRPARTLQRILAHARQAGAVTVLITDFATDTLHAPPDVALVASRGGEGESQSLTVPMAICNTLILELSRVDEGHSLQSLDKLMHLRRTLAPDGGGRR
jgi:DNA-binding MurR/RpiR family transcriptional regulator